MQQCCALALLKQAIDDDERQLKASESMPKLPYLSVAACVYARLLEMRAATAASSNQAGSRLPDGASETAQETETSPTPALDGVSKSASAGLEGQGGAGNDTAVTATLLRLAQHQLKLRSKQAALDSLTPTARYD